MKNSKFKPGTKITIFFIFFSIVFIGLGVWQVERGQSKSKILQAYNSAGEKDPRVIHGFEPFSRGHAPVGGILYARRSKAGSNDLRSDQAGTDQRRHGRIEDRRSGAERHRVLRKRIQGVVAGGTLIAS